MNSYGSPTVTLSFEQIEHGMLCVEMSRAVASGAVLTDNFEVTKANAHKAACEFWKGIISPTLPMPWATFKKESND